MFSNKARLKQPITTCYPLLMIVSPFFAKPEMGPSDFRSKKPATLYAFGVPALVLRHHGCGQLFEPILRQGSSNDLTPCRSALCFVSTCDEAADSDKTTALRLRGGRRTPRRLRADDFLYSFEACYLVPWAVEALLLTCFQSVVSISCILADAVVRGSRLA